jgi:hypoxanthine phosphoribosyltransferase
MSDEFYSYESRQGIRPISWHDFFGICKGLALAASVFEPDIVLGIARGGLYPATLVSHFLRTEFCPIRLTRRFKDRVVYDEPRWVLKPSAEFIKAQKVLIVDEICSEGKTLRAAIREVEALGARAIKTAVMYAHTWGQDIPDYIGIISDELILNPWDREIVGAGRFIMHPEYVHALNQQGMEPSPALLVGVEPRLLDKAAE